MNSTLLELDSRALSRTSAPDRQRSGHLFYAITSLAILLIVWFGFGPSYYMSRPALPPLVHLHALVFTAWVLLFVVQVSLAAGRRIELHRQLGIAGAVLAALLVALGLAASLAAARRNFPAGPAWESWVLALRLGDMLVFASLVAAGIHFRREPETHKRLMLLATANLLDAAFARWPFDFAQTRAGYFGGIDLIIAASVVHDLVSRRRVHPANLVGGLWIVASQAFRVKVLDGHPLWLALTRALVG